MTTPGTGTIEPASPINVGAVSSHRHFDELGVRTLETAHGCSARKLNTSPASNDGDAPGIHVIDSPESKAIGLSLISGSGESSFQAPPFLRHR